MGVLMALMIRRKALSVIWLRHVFSDRVVWDEPDQPSETH